MECDLSVCSVQCLSAFHKESQIFHEVQIYNNESGWTSIVDQTKKQICNCEDANIFDLHAISFQGLKCMAIHGCESHIFDLLLECKYFPGTPTTSKRLVAFSFRYSFSIFKFFRFLEIFRAISIPSGLSHHIYLESILERHKNAQGYYEYIDNEKNWKKAFIKADYMFSRIIIYNEQLKFNDSLNLIFKR